MWRGRPAGHREEHAVTGRAYGDNLDPEFSEALEGIPPLQERYSAAARPSDGSLAAQDGVTLLGRMAFDLSQVALGIGLEHLACWYALPLQARRMPAVTHFTLIRTALEGATLARWLLEPTTEGERISRSARAQWDDYEQQRQMQEVAGAPTEQRDGWKPALQKQRELLAAVDSAGLKLAERRSKTYRFDHYVFPEEEVAKHGGRRLGKLLYQILSAPSHAHQWSAYQGARWELLEESEVRPRTQTMLLSGRQDVAQVMTVIAVLAFSDAITEFERYGAQRSTGEGAS
jgi:hypothetical protein